MVPSACGSAPGVSSAGMTRNVELRMMARACRCPVCVQQLPFFACPGGQKPPLPLSAGPITTLGGVTSTFGPFTSAEQAAIANNATATTILSMTAHLDARAERDGVRGHPAPVATMTMLSKDYEKTKAGVARARSAAGERRR